MELLNKEMLPCIMFTNNRILCERLASQLANHLENSQMSLNKESGNEYLINLLNESKVEKIKEMIKVGVAWHHSGMSANSKALVEALFRLGI